MVDLDSIDAFVLKATAFQETIKGISNGTIDATSLSLKDYGILNLEEQHEEKDRIDQKKIERQRLEEERLAAKKQCERTKWWEGAELEYGTRKKEGVGSIEVWQIFIRVV